MGKLRIDFQVRDPQSDRFVTFGDDVSVQGIRDFFERAGLAVSKLFSLGAPKAMKLSAIPTNKIAAIKVIRDLTNCGLKEAKDFVELTPGNIICYFTDDQVAQQQLQKGRCTVAELTLVVASIQECIAANVPRCRHETEAPVTGTTP